MNALNAISITIKQRHDCYLEVDEHFDKSFKVFRLQVGGERAPPENDFTSPCVTRPSWQHMPNSRLLLSDLGQLILDDLVGRAYSHAREVYLPHWVVGRVEGGDRRLD